MNISLPRSAPGQPEGASASTNQSADFDQFYAATSHRLTQQLMAYLGNLSDAQDVVQEAYCRALARWSKISAYDDPAVWVRRVAWNLATSGFRRRQVAMKFLRKQREEHVDGPGPERIALTRALGLLPANQRKAIVLHYIGQLSIAEIAEQEGAAEGTVKSWLHRGRAELATLLADPENGIGRVVTNHRPVETAHAAPAGPRRGSNLPFPTDRQEPHDVRFRR